MSDFSPDLAEHDPELGRFLEAVVDLSARRHNRGPDEFLAQVQGLGDTFRGLLQHRTAETLSLSLGAFASKRFDLVDEPSEYPDAWDELMVLVLGVGESAPLVLPALKQAIERMSSHLSEEGVPALFGQMLKRTRQLARQHGDAELGAWVQGVIAALPESEPRTLEAGAWMQGLLDAMPQSEPRELGVWVQHVDVLPGAEPPPDDDGA
jgi:hypothetical protein